TVGWMLGHLYGGIMVNFFGQNGDKIVQFFGDVGITISEPTWRTLFWFNLITGTFTILAVIISLHGIPQTRLKERFDFLGTGLIVLALICLTLGLGNANPDSIRDSSTLQTAQSDVSQYTTPLLITSIIAFLLFIWVEVRSKYPLF